MRLVICEKQLAAKRIAEILSDNACKEHKIGSAVYYQDGDFLVVGLAGHVFNVDFSQDFKKWSLSTLKDLINGKINYIPDKKPIINAVKKLSKSATEAIVSTDFDTEGESIGLEAYNIVKSVSDIPVKRAKFSAITNDEIKDAFNNLSEIDFNLAYSADARREIDLIWGAVLTRFISLVSRRLGNYYLSVGRVQSPTLKLIVDKEKERLAFNPQTYWEVPLTLRKDKSEFTAYYKERRIFDKSVVTALLALNPKDALVKSVVKKERSVSPEPPLNTTEFIREAAKIGFSSMNSMRVAESLYLKGLISYPRTNNQVFSKSLDLKKILIKLKDGRHSKFIIDILSKPLNPVSGKESKDHPPIHPTGEPPLDLSSQEERIYDLVLKKFLATFMPPSLEELTRVIFDVKSYDFVSNGLRIVSPGFKALIKSSKEMILPELIAGESIPVLILESLEKMTEPPNRFGHGTLIKVMNDLNLGTKATRPEIIQKLIDRYYISRQGLIPTPIAFAVIDSLSNYASKVCDAQMTAELEDSMESIADAKLTKDEAVSISRRILSEILDDLLSKDKEIGESIKTAIRKSKIVGACPQCKSDLIIRVSRASKKRFIGCTGYPDCHNCYPLPQSGMVQVTPQSCKDCGINKMVLIRKGKRPFTFCPNINCPGRKEIKKAES